MKRFIWFTVILCLALTVFIACSDEEEVPVETSEEVSAEGTESETKKVVDKYDKYRGETTTKPSDTQGGGETSGEAGGTGETTKSPASNDEGFGEEFEWESGASYGYTVTQLSTRTQGINVIGERYSASEEFIPCDWTASGIEFIADLEGGAVSFEIRSYDKSNFLQPVGTLFRAYVDGAEWKNGDGDVYYTVFGNSTLTLRNIPAGEHNIRLVKATGYVLSLCEIRSVKYAGTIKTDTIADKSLYIEFVGDSISCGWGTVGEGSGAYTDQDGTLAYPYLVADALKADYAVTALSGQGLVEGSYKSIYDAYKYASIARDSENEYGFDRQADLVVINVGTNDIWINDTDEAAFKAKYKELIDYIKLKNGADCKILCVYGCMVTSGYTNSLSSWVEEWGGNTEGIYAVGLMGPGTGEHYHPTADEQAAHAQALLPTVKNILGIS